MYCGDQLCLDSISYLSIKSNSIIHFYGNTNSSGARPPCQVRSPRSLHVPSGGAGTNWSESALSRGGQTRAVPSGTSLPLGSQVPLTSGGGHEALPFPRRAPAAPARGGDSGTRQLAANAAPPGDSRRRRPTGRCRHRRPTRPNRCSAPDRHGRQPPRSCGFIVESGTCPGTRERCPPTRRKPPAARSEAAAPAGPDSAKLQERRTERRAEPRTPPHPCPTATPVASHSLQVSPAVPGGCEAVPETGGGRDAARRC